MKVRHNLLCFDSILVRLKALARPIEKNTVMCFDSILVRLKESSSVRSSISSSRFRFHTGSIKRVTAETFRDTPSVSIPYWFD